MNIKTILLIICAVLMPLIAWMLYQVLHSWALQTGNTNGLGVALSIFCIVGIVASAILAGYYFDQSENK